MSSGQEKDMEQFLKKDNEKNAYFCEKEINGASANRYDLKMIFEPRVK